MAIHTKMSAAELADAAIGLFLEYRDVHGYSEDDAQTAAASEVAQGVAAEVELRAAGQLPALTCICCPTARPEEEDHALGSC